MKMHTGLFKLRMRVVTLSKDAIEEAVNIITAQFKSSIIKERDDYTCATRRGFGNRRSYDGKTAENNLLRIPR